MIISVSRRTDIPACHSRWFMNKVREGSVIVTNPRNPKQQKAVSLHPNDVDCFVFWTKNPEPMLPYLSKLNELGYNYYFQFTLTPYDKNIERNLPPKTHLIDTFKRLSQTIGCDKILWRYDPIIVNDFHDVNYHTEAFGMLASELSGYTNKCVISFVDSYGFVTKRCKDILEFHQDNDAYFQIAKHFSEIASNYGIELSTCSENYDFAQLGIKKGSCIDKSIIENILNRKISSAKGTGQRPDCGCLKSIDIGTYNSCSNDCLYCYAMKSSFVNNR